MQTNQKPEISSIAHELMNNACLLLAAEHNPVEDGALGALLIAEKALAESLKKVRALIIA